MPHSTRYALGQLLYNRPAWWPVGRGPHIGDPIVRVRSGAGQLPLDVPARTRHYVNSQSGASVWRRKRRSCKRTDPEISNAANITRRSAIRRGSSGSVDRNAEATPTVIAAASSGANMALMRRLVDPDRCSIHKYQLNSTV